MHAVFKKGFSFSFVGMKEFCEENDDWAMETYILISDAMKVCYVEERGCFETGTEN